MFLSRKRLSQLKKYSLTQADSRKPCVDTEKSMNTQDNLANQEKVVVNGDTVYTQKLFDWCTHRFLYADTGFSCVGLCQEYFFN